MDPQLLSKQADNALRQVGSTSIKLMFGFGIFFAIVTSFRGGHYHYNWGREQGLFTFGSSLQYFTAGQIAFICFLIIRYLNKRCKTGSSGRAWLWLMMFPAFSFAACDETLVWHEKVLYKLVHQYPLLNHVRFAGTSADDLFVIGLALCGIIFTAFFIRELRVDPKARFYYLSGLALLLVAGAVDYFPREMLQNRLPLGTEELSEYFSGTCFTVSFILYALNRFRLVVGNWLGMQEYEETCLIPSEQPVTTGQLISDKMSQ